MAERGAGAAQAAAWVVKLGGSLNDDPSLPDWLHLLVAHGAGRLVLVGGGGAFADAVRHAQQRWRFDDLAAHNMAVLAMAQTAHLLRALQPALKPAADDAALRRVLAAGGVALWSPLSMRRERPDADTNWDVTSDSLALGLALRLKARRLTLVKRCDIPAGATFAELSDGGVLDRRFAALATQAAFPIDVVSHRSLDAMADALQAVG